jgi:hypothetical protein
MTGPLAAAAAGRGKMEFWNFPLARKFGTSCFTRSNCF